MANNLKLRKPRLWHNGGMRQIINTGCKTFDKQTSIIASGNQLARTMYGTYIRSSKILECNGYQNPPGYLQDFDLKNFKDYATKRVLDKTRYYADQHPKGCCLYMFFHFITNRKTHEKKRLVHGFIICDYDGEILEKIYTRHSNSSHQIVDECAYYLY